MKSEKEIQGFKVISAKEMLKDDIKYDDRSYRRGYHHGYEQALDDIRYGKNTTQFTKYDGELIRWRYGKKDYDWNEMITPPSAN